MLFGRRRFRPRLAASRRDALLVTVERIERWLAEVKAEQMRLLEADGQVDAGWLLPMRSELRGLAGLGHASALSCALNRADDDDTRTLLAWLLGRHVSPQALYSLDHCVEDQSPRVRRHTARALRRGEAWSRLAYMAAIWPDDPWVQRYAAEPKRTPHPERIARFVSRNVETVAPSPAPRMPLWALDRYWFLSPPKREEYLRRVLLRIQHWVHGHRS